MPSQMTNPLLRQIEDRIEAQLAPDNRENYMKILVAGMKLGLKDGPNGILAGLKDAQDPVATAARGAVNIVGLLSRSARGKMPEKAMVPAAMSLMLHALDFLEKTGKMKVDEAVLEKATKMFADDIMRLFGINNQKLSNMASMSHMVGMNPQALQQIQQFTSKGAQGGQPAAQPAQAPPAGAQPLLQQ